MASRKKKKSQQPPRKVTDTAGRRQLAAWRTVRGENTLTSLARRVGAAQPSVYQWFNGETRPVGERRVLVSKIIGCIADDWLTEEELANLEPLRAAANKRTRGGRAA